MDQQYWMRMLRNPLRGLLEERAFAEDAAGALGGCVWPPRMYSCSFCRKEFRSAQALGGHMNVHRRDRARLKQTQISDPHSEQLLRRHQNHSQTPTESFDSLDPNSIPNVVSVSSAALICSPSRTSDSAMKRNLNISDNSISITSDGSCVETNLTVGLGSVFCPKTQNRSTVSCAEEAIISCAKRPKIAVSALHFFVSNEIYPLGSHKSNSVEDSDLELRLGTEPPKVE